MNNNKKLTYALLENTHDADGNQRISYGICVCDASATRSDTVSVNDISSDKQAVEALIEKCNRLELSPIHLADVIEDFLA